MLGLAHEALEVYPLPEGRKEGGREGGRKGRREEGREGGHGIMNGRK